MSNSRRLILRVAVVCMSVVLLSPAAVTSAAPNVQLLSHSSYMDTSGYVHIVGEVQNNGSANAQFVRINFNFYNSSNTLLDTDFTYSDVDIMAPGEKSPFHNIFAPPAGYSHYAISSINASETSSSPNHNFTTTVTNTFVDVADYEHIVGQVTNNNTTTSEFVKVIFTFYNASGTTIDADFTYVNTGGNASLGPGQSASFELIRDTTPAYSQRVLLTQSNTPPSGSGTTYSGYDAQGGPEASSWGPGRLDVFVRGSRSQLLHKWYDNGWSAYEDFGGVLTADPAAVSWSVGRVDLFGRGTDGALWHKFYGGSWSGWGSLGGFLNSSPDVASWGPGRLDVFAVGTDGALWHQFHSGGWSGWASRGGVVVSDPAAVSWGANRIDLFVRGTDDALWHQFWNGSSWSGWQSLGGVLTSAAGVASWGNGRLDIFVRGTDNALWQKHYSDGQWSGWNSHGGVLVSDPSAVSWGFNRVDVFVTGTDSSIWQKSWTGANWTGWSSIGR